MIKIDKNINVIKFPGFEYPHCNCMWIEDELNCLIDTSPHKDDLDFLMTQRMDLIVNSHGHIDHYQYNHLFHDCRVLMHHADREIAQSPEKYTEAFGFNELVKNTAVEKFYLDAVHYRPTRIDEFLDDGRILTLGSTVMQTIHLPGHSPGHCGFLFPDKGFIFTADIDLSTFGPWYANINCSLKDLVSSINRVIEMKPDYIVTGHGEGIVKENYTIRLAEYRDIVFTRQKRIVDLLYNGNHTLDDIAGKCPVYQTLPKPEVIFYLYEQVMVLIHLRYLMESGFVIQDDGSYYLAEGVSPSMF